MTTLGTSIKRKLRISHNKLDDDIESDINTCLMDLRRVGVTEDKAVATTDDLLIQKACELYCKAQFDFNGQGDRFQKAYESFRDALSLGGDYTASEE